jgi:hypothetical protein
VDALLKELQADRVITHEAGKPRPIRLADMVRRACR